MILILSIFAALIPTLFYVGIIYWADHYEKEPLWLLSAAFLWGAIPSIIIALIFNSLLSIPFYALVEGETADALSASLIAPLVEESIKGLVLLIILFRWRQEIDSPLDGIIYGAVVGMGFAMVENIFYFLEVYNEGGLEAWEINVFIRGIIFGFNHALFTSMTGLGVALGRMSKNKFVRFAAPVAGWCVAMFLHFVHNASVSFGDLLCLVALATDWGGMWLTVGIVVWALVQERSWLRQYLADEVEGGMLTAVQYQRISSSRQRSAFAWQQLTGKGAKIYRYTLRFHHLCSKLAYKKHHYALFQDDNTAQEIITLRQQLTELGGHIV